MSFIRIGQETIQKRGEDRRAPAQHGHQGGYGHYFTQSKWQAMAYLSDRLILEDRFVDPFKVFPPRAVGQMRYGQRFGLVFSAMQYANSEGVPVGALGCVESSNIVLGFYAVRY